MKNLLKTLAVVAGAAVAVTSAHANSFTENDVEVLQIPLTAPKDAGDSLTVYTTVTQAAVGDPYNYTYNLNLPADATTVGTGIADFTVYLLGTVGSDFISGYSNLGTFTTPTPGAGATSVIWNSIGDVDVPLNPPTGLTFDFNSPLPPAFSSSSAVDAGAYAQISGSVLVPNVPDGGLTIALLGGSLLGLQAIRRKLSL